MNDELQRSLDSGINWLVAQQARDGGWHSATYGQLKEGAAVTTLVLAALGNAPRATQQKHTGAIKRAYAFLDRGLAKKQTIAAPDGTLDFPTYAAALWLTSRRKLRLSIPAPQGKQVLDYLVGAQVTETRGFAADSPSFGGWDFLGPDDAQGITTGTNISVTRYVLEALACEESDQQASGGREPPVTIRQALDRGREYVLRCQQPDGGFAFTCEPASLSNKAAYHDERLTAPRSYGTATCDGVRALLAGGGQAADEPLAKAIDWLAERSGLELVPGFEHLPPEAGWQRGLRYYYYTGLAAVLRHFPAGELERRREALVEHLTGLQTGGGWWVNESDRMRENDPLIATSLAVTALGECHGKDAV
ncbi:MAG: prenyltransferase/squalene oxidase repeat-containing protein [Pirellulaceae bacterium]